MGGKEILFFVLGALSVASAFKNLIPTNNELVFDYEAVMRAGTHVPASFASYFVLKGNLHMQLDGSDVLVRLSNLTYKLGNGKLDHLHEYEAHEVPLPKEMEKLKNPFRILYNNQGIISEIAIDETEEQFVINIKRSVAGILQMETEKVMQIKNHAPHSFITQEASIHGESEVLYNVQDYDLGKKIEVHKMYMMDENDSLFQYTISGTVKHCEMKPLSPLSRDTQRKYLLVKDQDGYTIDRIEANGGIYYHPLGGSSEAYYIFVNQTMHKMQTMPIKEKLQAGNAKQSLKYYLMDFEDKTGAVLDITNGRRKINPDEFLPMIVDMFKQALQYLEDDHIHTKIPIIEKGQLIVRIQRVMMYLDSKNLNSLLNQIKTQGEDMEDLFYEILPTVGSKASVLMIMDLIENLKVKNAVINDMLEKMPMHIKTPTQDLVQKLETMFNWNDTYAHTVRQKAIFAFAAIVGKSYRFVKQQQELTNHEDKNKITKATDTIKIYYEKYIMKFIEKIQSVQDVKEQRPYIIALANLKMDIMEYIIPGIRGEWGSDQRMLFMWVVDNSNIKNTDMVYEVFWPILTDELEPVELRITAYKIIMELLPSEATFTNMYWALKTEPNPELYNFHYSFHKYLVKRGDDCHSSMKTHAAEMLKFMQPPKQGISSYHITDYLDSKWKFGMGFEGMVIHSREAFIMNGLVNWQVDNTHDEKLQIRIKIHKENPQGHGLMNIANGKSYEVIIMKHGLVIHSFYFTKSLSTGLNDILMLIFAKHNSDVSKSTNVNFNKYTKNIMLTDIGMPVVFDEIMSVTYRTSLNFTEDGINKYFHKLDMKMWAHARHGISVYNTILDVWQGVNKYHSHDINVPMSFDLTIPKLENIKLSIKTSKQMGMRSHVASMVFVKEEIEKNILKQSSPRDQPFVIVSHGKDILHKHVLFSKDDLMTGRKWEGMVYDTEDYPSNNTFTKAIKEMMRPLGKPSRNPLQHFLMGLLNLYHRFLIQPKPGTNGILLRAEASSHKVSSIDLTFKMNYDETNSIYYLTKADKLTFRISYSIKNENTALKTWDIQTVLNRNLGHTINSLKMLFTRIIPGQKDFKICLEGTKKWEGEEVIGQMTVAMSQTPEGCGKDDIVIDVNMMGKYSEEQKEHNDYGACSYTIPYFTHQFHTTSCLAAHSSVRDYEFNIKTNNLPTEFKLMFNNMWDMMKSYYITYYSYDNEPEEKVPENNLKVKIIYPMEGGIVNIDVFTPYNKLSLSEMPIKHLQYFGLEPDLINYPEEFIFQKALDQVDVCTIRNSTTVLNSKTSTFKVQKDWVMFLGDKEEDPKTALYVKVHEDNKMAVMIKSEDHVLEVTPQGKTFKFMMDGKEIYKTRNFENWISWILLSDGQVTLSLDHFGIYAVMYDYYLIVDVLMDPKWKGNCFKTL